MRGGSLISFKIQSNLKRLKKEATARVHLLYSKSQSGDKEKSTNAPAGGDG